MTNEEQSELQKKYKEFYASMLDKFGVKSPGEMDDAKKKEFFAAIEKGWKEGEGPVKEEAEIDEKKMTADAKRKQNVKRATPAGKKAAKKHAKKTGKKVRSGY